MLCKLDIEKAYDHVSWDFLTNMFQRCGFSKNDGNGLCFKSQLSNTPILINGTPIGFFGSSRGICQRDPLYPLLFDIVREALSHMLDVAATIGQFSSLHRHLG